MRSGNWRAQGSFHPVHDAQEIHDYFEERLAGMEEAGHLG